MFDIVVDMLKDIFAAWNHGRRPVRRIILVLVVLIPIVITVSAYAITFEENRRVFRVIALSTAGIATFFLFLISAYNRSERDKKAENRLDNIKQRTKENPKETQAAWELAQVNLESYINSNLRQVRSIFLLTVFVMLVGFALVAYGVYLLYTSPDSLNASVLSTAAGVVTNLIGATFLALYRSMLKQTHGYVAVLERMNAVGMSVQLAEKLEDTTTPGHKQQTTATLAKSILQLYDSVETVSWSDTETTTTSVPNPHPSTPPKG